ncbi:hypothetical protein D3C81_386530 [compost metagenome]
MFHKRLLSDGPWYLAIDWFGLGPLVASHVPSGRSSRAPAQTKTLMLETAKELLALGVRQGPGCRPMTALFVTYADITLDPTSLSSRTVMSQTPAAVARLIVDKHGLT